MTTAQLKRVLILCTGNSCRSQMAEIIWKNLAPDYWQVESAGSAPAGFVHPQAIAALQEIDLPTNNLRSKHLDEFQGQKIDLVVTVCDNAQNNCPTFPAAEMLHWPFDDPADATGSSEEIAQSFRQVRDQIREAIQSYLTQQSFTLEFDAPTANEAAQLIALSLTEDVGSADIGIGIDCTTDALVPHGACAEAGFVSREQGTVAGTAVAKLAIANHATNVTLDVLIEDGQPVKPGQTIAIIKGSAHEILTLERTCLNFMCRLSGIASLASKFSSRVADTSAQILDTRKTTPGWRRLEKYAVACGGGTNHRMGLFDAVMIKDNHLAFFKTQVDSEAEIISQAVKQTRQWIIQHANQLPAGEDTRIYLEVDSLNQFQQALSTSADVVLLDNMNNEQLRQAVEMRAAAGSSVLLEASGGVNLDTVRGIAETGIDRISIGALTHSATNFDIGLDWRTRSVNSTLMNH